MLISFNLLKKYVPLPKSVTAEEVGRRLTESVVEVEGVREQGESLENMFVGKVVRLEKHPNADKLKIAWVDLGQKLKKSKNQEIKDYFDEKGLVKVVCGGTNLREGQKIAFALPGARVRWHGEGDLITLEKAKIRGEESCGMICASDEIGLADLFPHKEGEILDFGEANYKIGEPLSEALGMDDNIIDIDNKSITNRPDLWGHYGIAREVAALYGLELREVEIDEKSEIKLGSFGSLGMDIQDKELCPRYLGCVVKNIKIEESPEWMRNALNAAGIKSINNIVDITNYVMIELGQPMHAFDRKLIGADAGTDKTQIIVRRAEAGEKLKLLDESEMELDEEMLVITNDKEVIALAGVMGGMKSGINDETTEIMFEAANFDAINVRRTAAKTVRTESAMRFEKSLDTNLAEVAMRRALFLTRELIPEAVIEEIAEIGAAGAKEHIIDVSLEVLNKKIGVELSSDEVANILHSLGFEIIRRLSPEGSDDVILKIKVPSWRATGDISIVEDVIEEVARVYGYGRIKPQSPTVVMEAVKEEKLKKTIDQLKDLLALGLGMDEIYNYAFVDKNIWAGEAIEILNPVSEENKFLRRELWMGLMKNVRDNTRYFDDFKLFEIGRVFINEPGEFVVEGKSKDTLPHQPYHIGGVVVAADKNSEVFYDIKGVVEEIISYQLSVINWRFEECAERFNFLDEHRAVDIFVGDKKIGGFGEINTETKKKFKIKNRRVAMFEIDLEPLIAASGESSEKKFKELPKYPGIERDIAIEVDSSVKWLEVEQVIRGVGDFGEIIKSAEFLSEFPLENKKSLAFRLKYQAKDRTLEDLDAEKCEQKILGELRKKVGAELRG